MPTPSKFTAERRKKILEALQVGASRRTAAAIAGVGHDAITRWLKRGEDAARGTSFREFYEAVLEAEAHPKMRALGVIYKEMPDNPMLAWKFIERRESGFEAPMPNRDTRPAGPIVVELKWADGASLPSSTVEALPPYEELEPNSSGHSA